MLEKDREIKEKTKLSKRLGKHIVKLRELKGISAAELARNCYMERSSIARIEMGRTNPSLFVIKKIISGLNMNFKEFFDSFE